MELGISPHPFLPSDWDLQHHLPQFPGLWTPVTHMAGSWGSSLQQQVMGLLRPQAHERIAKNKSPFIRISYGIGFSGEP